jgi:hypothetical protein
VATPRLREPKLRVRVIVEAVGKKYRRWVPVSFFDEDAEGEGRGGRHSD